MGLSEEDKKQAFDKANSYRLMMKSWAWQDYVNFLDRLKAQTINDFISMDEKTSVEFKAGQYKGFLDCLTKIKAEIDFIVK